MPVGPILLAVLIVLVWSGFFARTLAQLRLSRRATISLLLAALFGSGVDLPIGHGFSVSLGGAVLPLAVALWFTAMGEGREKPAWSLAGALLSGVLVHLMGRWFPPGAPTELNLFNLDAQYLYGLVAGLVGFVVGRTPRSAFATASLGVILSDVAHVLVGLQAGASVSGIPIGGGGFQETAIVAGVLAVALSRLVGDSQAHPAIEQ